MLCFRGRRRPEKIYQKFRHFSMQNSQASSKKKSAKVFWRAGTVSNRGYSERCHSVTNSSFQVPLSEVPGDTLGDPLGDPRRDPRTSQNLSRMSPLFLLPLETSLTQKLSAPKSQRFLRFAIAMPIADPRNRAISETRESSVALRFRGAMESR